MATRAWMSHANPYLYQDMKGHPVIIITISNIHSNTSKYNEKNVWGGFSQLSLICHCRTESKRNNKETLWFEKGNLSTINTTKQWPYQITRHGVLWLIHTHKRIHQQQTRHDVQYLLWVSHHPTSITDSPPTTVLGGAHRCEGWSVMHIIKAYWLVIPSHHPFFSHLKTQSQMSDLFMEDKISLFLFLHASISWTRIEYFFVWRKSISDQQSLWRVCCSHMDWLNSPCDLATQKTRTSMEGCNIVQQMTILGAGR